jgi:hypothetical protein
VYEAWSEGGADVSAQERFEAARERMERSLFAALGVGHDVHADLYSGRFAEVLGVPEEDAAAWMEAAHQRCRRTADSLGRPDAMDDLRGLALEALLLGWELRASYADFTP